MTTNPELDLVLERIIDVSPELVWQAWTTPEQLKKWFTPAPWKTVGCEIDLRPGGAFRTVMQSPEGEDFPVAGCYLEIVENRRLVWTNAVAPGYRPARAADLASGDLTFTGVILMEPHGAGTKYTAIAMHADVETCQKHESMGFHQGWGAALDQMVAMVKAL
ncbi:MAG TPA: SRPBCC family protein [Paludibaculum sp.]|jgi:uncharacterized protein YndB with AHSA1/START domain